MKQLLLIMIFVCLSSPAFSADKEDIAFTISQIAYTASVGVDYYSGARLDSTYYKEANPILTNNRIAQGFIMGGIAGFTLWGVRRYYKRNAWAAIAILAGSTVVHALATRHNFGLR